MANNNGYAKFKCDSCGRVYSTRGMKIYMNEALCRACLAKKNKIKIKIRRIGW